MSGTFEVNFDFQHAFVCWVALNLQFLVESNLEETGVKEGSLKDLKIRLIMQRFFEVHNSIYQ